MRSIGLFLFIGALATACAQPPSTESGPKTVESAAPPNAVASAADAREPDDILQERLREVVRVFPDMKAIRERGSALVIDNGEPTTAKIEVEGPLDPALVSPTQESFQRLYDCYDAGFRKKPGLTGIAITKFTVTEAGVTTGVKSTGDLPAEVLSCIEKVFVEMTSPKQSSPTKVTYPLRFSKVDRMPSEGPWPVAVVDGTRVLLGGKFVGDTNAILAAPRFLRLDELFSAMKTWREEWKAKNPEVAFPGVAGLRIEPTTPARVMKSVFQTMAYAGYPDICIQASGAPATVHRVAAFVPGPPDPTVTPPPLPLRMHLHVSGTEAALEWKRGSDVVVAEEKVSRADLAEKLCASWRKNGEHQEPADVREDELFVHADDALSYRDIAAAFEAAAACKRSGPNGEHEALRTTFDIR